MPPTSRHLLFHRLRSQCPNGRLSNSKYSKLQLITIFLFQNLHFIFTNHTDISNDEYIELNYSQTSNFLLNYDINLKKTLRSVYLQISIKEYFEKRTTFKFDKTVSVCELTKARRMNPVIQVILDVFSKHSNFKLQCVVPAGYYFLKNFGFTSDQAQFLRSFIRVDTTWKVSLNYSEKLRMGSVGFLYINHEGYFYK